MIRAVFLIPLLLASLTALHAAAPDLSKVTSRADLDSLISATPDATLKQALSDHAGEILVAAEQHPHVEAVVRTIESALGAFTKINTTPDALKKATGGDMAIFDTLTQVSTNILGGKAHDQRKENADPYNAAFIELRRMAFVFLKDCLSKATILIKSSCGKTSTSTSLALHA